MAASDVLIEPWPRQEDFRLIGALVVLPPVMGILYSLFMNASGSMQADSISGLFSWVVEIAIYVMVCVTVMHKIFALIHVIPNSVPRWFGGHASGHDKGAETEHESKAAVMGAIMAGRNAGSGAMTHLRQTAQSKQSGANHPGEGGGGAKDPGESQKLAGQLQPAAAEGNNNGATPDTQSAKV